MSVDLTTFRNATELYWQQHTVFEAGRGVDGTLVADKRTRLPLDIYSPDEVTSFTRTPLGDGVGVVVATVPTFDDVHEAIRSWCREQLGRDDVGFDGDAPA